MEALTRTPVNIPETTETPEPRSTEEPVIPREGSEPTPKELKELDRAPYVVDLLEIGKIYNTLEVKKQSQEIDEFVLAEMERGKLEDTRENYDKVLKELWKKITPTDNIYTNIEELLEFVRIKRKLIEALEEKKAFEAKDPSEMTARELERYINGQL